VDFDLANDHNFLAVDLDLGPGVLAEQDPVPHLHVQGQLLPVLEHPAVADGQHLALHGLLLRRVGNDDAALGGLFSSMRRTSIRS
jgi:hypothetical protein